MGAGGTRGVGALAGAVVLVMGVCAVAVASAGEGTVAAGTRAPVATSAESGSSGDVHAGAPRMGHPEAPKRERLADREDPAGRKGQVSPPQSAAAPAAVGTNPSAPERVLPLTSDQVAAHMGQTVDWFHHLAAGAEQLQIADVDSVARSRLHQQSLTAVGLAFDFGKACVVLLNEQARQAAAATAAASSGGKAVLPKGSADSNSPGTSVVAAKGATESKGFAGRLDEANENVGQRVAALQTQLDSLNAQLSRARGKERETLLAQQAQAEAALRLAKEVLGSVQAMQEFEASSIAGDNGNLSPLEGQLADMERSVPELGRATGFGGSAGGAAAGGIGGTAGNMGSGGGTMGRGLAGGGSPGTAAAEGGGAGGGASARSGSGSGGAGSASAASATNATTSSAKSTAPFRPESAGVIALATEWFSLNGTRRQLGDFIKETDDLQEEIGKVRGTLTDEVRTVLGNDLALSTSNDPTQLLAQRQELEADSTRFKKLSTVLVPLGEQALTVDAVAGVLDDWRASLDARMSGVARYLALRIGIVLGWVAVVLIISEIWRRATFRYLHDLRRRRQFMVLRRVAVGIALTLVIAFGLVSEIGSIATYIGFVTAGVAVALQNVILAVVAYFFFIGRYGVRVGDRVTLSGVTGRVVDIGLVRIYLMELSGPDLHSTGRMVVLSNAVLFQPTAMFKQIPGADYVWHTVTLTIAATADVVEAHKRLKAASDEVYAKYRSAIERQHAVVQRFIDFDAASPQPEVRVRLTENGLECSVRYPVELENAAVIDQRMLKALQGALEGDAQFKLVSSGAVMLKSE